MVGGLGSDAEAKPVTFYAAVPAHQTSRATTAATEARNNASGRSQRQSDRDASKNICGTLTIVIGYVS